MDRLFELAARLFGGAILVFFAFAPAWILFDLIKTLLFDPSDLDLLAFFAFIVCSALLYFMLLLAYRAFTGSGRRKDGGLLPPWALKIFAASFGLIGIAIAIFGGLQGDLRPLLGGLGYLGSALVLYRVVRHRRQRSASLQSFASNAREALTEVDTLIVGRNAVATIAKRFPDLQWLENEDDPVELSVTLPVQDGHNHEVWLGLQNNDELTFGVGHFQVEWFPCTDSTCVAVFIDAVSGWISGEYRILEHYRGSHCVKAELQTPNDGQWKTIATWATLWLPFPLTKTFRVVRNAREVSANVG